MVMKTVPEIFSSASLSIIPTESESGNPNPNATNTSTTSNATNSTCRSTSTLPTSAILQHETNESIYITSAYFRDATSKRAKVVIPILINFQNDFERKKLLKSGAIQPAPSESNDGNNNVNSNGNDNGDNSKEGSNGNGNDDANNITLEDAEKDMWDAELDLIGETHEDDELEMYGKNEIKFECTYINKRPDQGQDQDQGEADLDEEDEDCNDAIIEGVKVLSTSLVNSGHTTGIRFDLEISVCVSPISILTPTGTGTGSGSGSNSTNTITSTFNNNLEHDLQKRAQAEISKTKLEIRALLISSNSQEEKAKAYSYLPSPRHRGSVDKLDDVVDDIRLGLQALDMGISSQTPFVAHELGRGDHHHPSVSYFSQSLYYYLPPKDQKAPLLKLNILPALLVSVRGMSAAASKTGNTLVSLVVYHSNVHNENVTITNIALHAGQSRLLDIEHVEHINTSMHTNFNANVPNSNIRNTGKAMPGGENAVVDMTKNVRWGYASGTAPSLPLVLKPQEAFATVLQINANEIMMERAFTSPIGIRAAVGDVHVLRTRMDSDSQASDIFRNEKGKSSSVVMVTADADWTTSPIAMKSTSTDAFRTSLSVRETVCTVGAQVVVGLKVMNLSSDPRDLMLIMAKDDDAESSENSGTETGTGTGTGTASRTNSKDRRSHLKGMSFAGGKMKSASTLGMMGASGHDNISSSHQSASTVTPVKNTVNNAVVSEVSGYTFGCWGLSGYDDGTIRHNRDHDLLAVDAALLLGEVKGQHAIEAELRFVSLREGTLSVPNLKLYDKVEQKWYDCYHTLKIISVAKQ